MGPMTRIELALRVAPVASGCIGAPLCLLSHIGPFRPGRTWSSCSCVLRCNPLERCTLYDPSGSFHPVRLCLAQSLSSRGSAPSVVWSGLWSRGGCEPTSPLNERGSVHLSYPAMLAPLIPIFVVPISYLVLPLISSLCPEGNVGVGGCGPAPGIDPESQHR